jgi:murein DD-endopeptidase MepM/ murein hydrolase activator NlpD
MVFSLCFYLVHTTLFAFLNPQYNELETNRRIIELSSQVDSMAVEERRVEKYASNLRRILLGMDPGEDMNKSELRKPSPVKKDINLDSISQIDLQLRKEIEEEEASLVNVNAKSLKIQENYFFKPAEGIVNQKFDPQNGFFGLEIATKSGEIVKSIGEGVVVFSNFTEEGFIIGIQHKNGFISIYKQNSRLLKSTGDYVHSGEGIAIPGVKNESKSGIVQLFIWKDGNPVNPENYISF